MTTDLTQILQTVTDGIVLFGHEGNRIFLNSKAEDVLRVSADESSLLVKIEDEVGRICASKISPPITFDVDDQDKNRHMVCTLLNYEDGYAAIIKDQSVRVQQEAFIDNILMLLNHELRTPMNGFIGSVQLAAEILSGDGRIDARELEKLADIASRTGRKITSKLERLLELSRLHSDDSIVADERINVRELALAAYDGVLSYAENKLVSIEFEGFENSLGTVYGSKKSLSMVISECLMNAIENSDSESGITFAARQKGEYVQFSIRDHGKGIAPGIGRVIFEAFSMGDKPATQCEKGLGIGLSLSKRIVELHGGTIKVISDSGIGAEFIIELPTGRPNQTSVDMQERQALRYAEDISVLMAKQKQASEMQ